MWRPWRKSSVKIHDTYSPTTASFKDIHHLCSDDSSSPSSSFPSSPCPSPRNASRVFHRVCAANLILKSWPTRQQSNPLLRADSEPIRRNNPNPEPQTKPKPEPDVRITIPGSENSIVVYFTSLRVVRQTFEACKSVTSILHSFPVRIDERDLSMDASFSTELQRIFANNEKEEKKITPKLPRVFIGGRYIGGEEEVVKLHEIGELKKMVQELPKIERGVCEMCGGHRFVPCKDCHGSHKVHNEKLGGGFRTCLACNENGLVRCSSCSFSTTTTASPPSHPN